MIVHRELTPAMRVQARRGTRSTILHLKIGYK